MNPQKGAALLIVLMILALMAALAAEMTLSFQTQLQRSRRTNASVQAKYALLYAEGEATAGVLKHDDERLNGKADLDADTTVSWRTEERQQCFNLNALENAPVEGMATPPYETSVFQALLEQLGAEKNRAEEIIQSTADYIDADTSPRLKGAEDEYYLQNGIHSLTANQMIFLPAEIRTLKGMTAPLWQKLAPFVCTAFSSELNININTLTEAQAPLLAALFLNDISTSDAKALLKKRPRDGWKTVDAFLYQAQQDHSAAKARVDTLKKYLTVTSHYFVTTSSAREGELSSGMKTFFYYDDKKKTIGIYLRQLTDGEHDE